MKEVQGSLNVSLIWRGSKLMLKIVWQEMGFFLKSRAWFGLVSYNDTWRSMMTNDEVSAECNISVTRMALRNFVRWTPQSSAENLTGFLGMGVVFCFCWPREIIIILAGCNSKIFIFTPILGFQMIQFDEHIFQMGLNHQLAGYTPQ